MCGDEKRIASTERKRNDAALLELQKKLLSKYCESLTVHVER